MDLLTTHRLLGPATAASGVLALVALANSSLLGAPLAVVFVVAAFLWSLSRADGPPRPRPADCDGCAAGCVRCRERIDAV